MTRPGRGKRFKPTPVRHSPRRRTLDRYLSRCGVASRTGALRLIEERRVCVNGRVANDPRLWIRPDQDRVLVDGRPVAPPHRRRVVVYHKPRGEIVTARDPEQRRVASLPEPFGSDRSLKPVGRLDRASSGLLLFVNDTELAARLLDQKTRLPKSYRVKLIPPPSSRAVGHMASGMDLGDDRPTAPARVSVERRSEQSAVLHIVLTEGRNRQIRRMAAKVGSDVDWLVRIRFGPIDLDTLPVGAAREATPQEVESLVACASLE